MFENSLETIASMGIIVLTSRDKMPQGVIAPFCLSSSTKLIQLVS